MGDDGGRWVGDDRGVGGAGGRNAGNKFFKKFSKKLMVSMENAKFESGI